MAAVAPCAAPRGCIRIAVDERNILLLPVRKRGENGGSLRRRAGSPELALAFANNTSADCTTTLVATRETNFSASLLAVSIPDAQRPPANRQWSRLDPQSPVRPSGRLPKSECPRRAGSTEPRRKSGHTIPNVFVLDNPSMHVTKVCDAALPVIRIWEQPDAPVSFAALFLDLAYISS